MAKRNGTWKVVGILATMVTTVLIIIGSFIFSYGKHDEKVEKIEKDVEIM